MKKEFRIAILVMLVISVLASGCSKNKSANVYRDSGSYYTEEYEYDDYLADGMMDMDMVYAAEESAAYSKSVPAASATSPTVAAVLPPIIRVSTVMFSFQTLDCL